LREIPPAVAGIASQAPCHFALAARHDTFQHDGMLRKPRLTGTSRRLSKSNKQAARQLLKIFSGFSKIIYAAFQSLEWHSNERYIRRAIAAMSLQLTDN